MVTYMPLPQNKLTLGTTSFINYILSAKVTRLENGFDNATITLPDTSLYPATVNTGTAIQLEVKDIEDAGYTKILKGIVRFLNVNIESSGQVLVLSCDGAGYGLGESVCGQEYGAQSQTGLSTLPNIITDATHGMLPKHINGVLASGNPSGYNYTSDIVAATEIIQYINFPYKPNHKCLNDLCDLETALRNGSSGTHWIVTTDDVLHVKFVDASGTGWTKYYGNSQANATLTYPDDYISLAPFEKLSKEANFIIYYGIWRRPSNGDAWTENSATLWDHTVANVELDDSTVHNVGLKSIRLQRLAGAGGFGWYPLAKTANWDFDTNFSPFNIPSISFYVRRSSDNFGDIAITLCTDDANFYNCSLLAKMTKKDVWYYFNIPIGKYWNQDETNEYAWSTVGTPSWTNIDYIQLGFSNNNSSEYLYIDGLYFGNAAVCRVAREKYPGEGGTLGEIVAGVCVNPVKTRVITDDVGKDDSLVATDDSGMMAQLAKAELQRLQQTSLVGTIRTRMIKDLLPGQWLNVQGTDMRSTKVIQNIQPSPEGYTSEISLTDDLVNGRTRLRYEDVNKQYADMRPEFQDRQASSIKAGAIDIRTPRLEKYY